MSDLKGLTLRQKFKSLEWLHELSLALNDLIFEV
jgi:hypothetical protein